MSKTPRKSRKAAEKSGESLSQGAEEVAPETSDKDIRERERRGRSGRPSGKVDPSSYTGVNPPPEK